MHPDLYSCTQTCTLLHPLKFIGEFQGHWRHLILPIFILSFWLSSWLPQLILLPRAVTMQKQLPLIVFRKFPGDRPSLLSKLSQRETIPENGDISRGCYAGQIETNWDASFGELQTHDGYVTAVFHSYMVLRLMLFTVPEDIVSAEWEHAGYNATALTPSVMIQPFLLTKHASVGCKPLVHFCTFEKFMSTIFIVFSLFIWVFRSPYSSISQMFSLWLFVLNYITLHEKLNSSLTHTSHILSAQQQLVANNDYIGQCRHKVYFIAESSLGKN